MKITRHINNLLSSLHYGGHMVERIDGKIYLSPVIAVIDDEPAILRATTRIMSKAGYRTRCYDSAIGFLASIEEGIAGVPDAILTDFNMPSMNADKMISIIKESYPAFFNEDPIIGMTGLDNTKAFLDAGAIAVFEKPFESKRLVDLIDSLPTTQYFRS